MGKARTSPEGTFTDHGLRRTRPRVALLTALSSRTDHPTADDLFQQLNGDVPAISLATVYNTLETFCQVGLAKKLAGTGGKSSARFDATCDDHLHLRCSRSGKVVDVPDDIGQLILKRIPKKTLAQLEVKLGFNINQVQIELIGEFDKTRRTGGRKNK